MAKNLVEI